MTLEQATAQWHQAMIEMCQAADEDALRTWQADEASMLAVHASEELNHRALLADESAPPHLRSQAQIQQALRDMHVDLYSEYDVYYNIRSLSARIATSQGKLNTLSISVAASDERILPTQEEIEAFFSGEWPGEYLDFENTSLAKHFHFDYLDNEGYRKQLMQAVWEKIQETMLDAVKPFYS